MNENKRYTRVLTFISLLFIIVLGYMTYFQVFKAEAYKVAEDNKRNWVDDNKLKRGNILDRDGNIIAETKENENGEKYRYFPYEDVYAHIIGYNSKKYGKTGLEKRYNTTLLNKQDKTPIGEIKKMLIEQKEGNSLKTTINTELQQLGHSLLQGHKGSIIVMNPQTGEVLTMASLPSFNPNTINENWQNIISDEENSPLLARSTMGLYAPGSVFKLVTGTLLLENLKPSELKYHDTGSTVIKGYKINNYNGNYYGNMDLRRALEKSSNTYFAEKIQLVGADPMIELNKRFMFGKEIDFDIPVSVSPIGFDSGMNELELASGAFGQGKVLVTPLQVALYTSAIANEGRMMKPILVKEILDPNGKVIDKRSPELLSKVADKKTMDTMKDYMASTGDENFGSFVNGQRVAGKTGTAEVKKDSTHAWVTCFYPVQNPTLVCTIVLEEENQLGLTAIPLAKKMINKALELGY